VIDWRTGNQLHIVEDIADRCVVLKKGRIAGDGTPAQILADENLLMLHGRHRHGSGVVHSHSHLNRTRATRTRINRRPTAIR
jgi:ABC-type hemin transport system ATPase subunit